ncbi:Acph-1 [Drosophila busckii]|uniref:acid phosphatase n=1 Tax=Drosophila busckii TaxID=30019 RepID=A0A0M3QYK3_DROBS|nr:Acph-1 [Drosophila busckii]
MAHSQGYFSMSFILLSTICIINFAIGESKGVDVQEALPGKLKFAHVIFRHGDRMPVDPYPTDPWNDRKYWPNLWGQLTNRGKQQHYELGKWLRQRYSALLNATYSREEIYVQSTDVDRTLMSAQANLAGLYEPVGSDVWNKEIKWQPIPVHSLPEEEDVILAAKAPCPAYDYAMKNMLESSEMQAMLAKYKELFSYIESNSGRSIKTFLDAQYINNTMFIETLYGKALPVWAQKIYGSADFTDVANFAFAINTYTRQMARLKVGPLLKDILQRMEKKTTKQLKPDRSVYIYSAHDTTVANLLNALKLFDVHSPPYVACILMELRVDDNEKPSVSVYYKNTTAEPQAMDIPGCGILIVIIAVLLCVSYGLMIFYRRRNYNFNTPYDEMA